MVGVARSGLKQTCFPAQIIRILDNDHQTVVGMAVMEPSDT